MRRALSLAAVGISSLSAAFSGALALADGRYSGMAGLLIAACGMSFLVAAAIDGLEEGRQIVTALVMALAKYRPEELPLGDWSDRQVIQQAMRWLEENGWTPTA